LTHPLFLSAKALDMTADLYTRVWPIFLEQLPAEIRANMNAARDMDNGRVSLTVKLMAWNLCEKLGLAEKLNGDINLPTGADKAHRFYTHRACAAYLMAHYLTTGEQGPAYAGATAAHCAPILDSVLSKRQADVAKHTQIAEQSGVLDQIRSGSVVRIPWSALWDHLSEVDIQGALSNVLAHGQTVQFGTTNWVPPSKFIHLYSEAREFRSPRAMVEALTGQTGKWGIQQLGHAFATCIRSYYHGRMSYNIDNLTWLPVPGSRTWECTVLSTLNQTLMTFRQVKPEKRDKGMERVAGLKK
jgi:hypothetical protein